MAYGAGSKRKRGCRALRGSPFSIFSNPRFAKQRLEDHLCAKITGASVG